MATSDDDFATVDESTRKHDPPAGNQNEPIGPISMTSSSATQEPQEPASDVARYEVRSLLGVGGMGEVRFCKDRRIGREVAMKVIRPSHESDSLMRLRFLREARVQAQLEHPAIVPVYDLGVDRDGSAYFTMKRLRGMTLAKILRSLRKGDAQVVQSFSRRKLLTAFSSICLAIDYAHSRGVLHRDLKPSNIMLGDFGEVYVLDWGIARIMNAPTQAVDAAPTEHASARSGTSAGAETTAGHVLGTLGYLSPEQGRGEIDTLDGRTDVYSLGAILFEMLTLTPLHPKRTAGELLASLIEGADARASVRAPERDVPPELDAICVKATQRDPAERFASASALHDAVERFLAGDRDLQLRRELAAQHALLAEQCTDEALRAPDGADATRRKAVGEVGRSLALDPSNERALRALQRILTEPPRVMPAEVLTAMDTVARARSTLLLREILAAELVGAVLAVLGFVFLHGTVEHAYLVGILVFMAAASAMKYVASRAPGRDLSARYAYAGYLFNVLAFLCAGRTFGPLFFMPMLLVLYTYGNSMSPIKAYRIAVLATACVALVGAVGVELAGILPRSYSFSDGAMIILPRGIVHSAIPTITALTLATLFVLVAGVSLMSKHQQALRNAEQRAFFQTWQLRQLLPERPSP